MPFEEVLQKIILSGSVVTEKVSDLLGGWFEWSDSRATAITVLVYLLIFYFITKVANAMSKPVKIAIIVLLVWVILGLFGLP